MQEQTIHWRDAGLTRIPLALYNDDAPSSSSLAALALRL